MAAQVAPSWWEVGGRSGEGGHIDYRTSHITVGAFIREWGRDGLHRDVGNS